MDPRIIAALRANATAPAAQSGKAVWRNGRFELPKGPTRGRGGPLTSFISEASGAGGATGGAALGATIGSVVPGAGTLIGGVIGGGIGGLLGGFGGRAVENKVRDDEYRVNDALKEGALSGALGAAGGAFQAARGLKAVGGMNGLRAATAAGGDDALIAGSKSILKGGAGAGKVLAGGGDDAANLLTKAGGSLRKNVVNPKTSASVFGAGEDEAITQTVNKYVKGISASGKYKNLGGAVNNLSDDITKELGKVSGRTTVADVSKKMTQSLADDLRFVPGDSAYERELTRTLSKLQAASKNGALSAQDLFTFKKSLSGQLSNAFKKEAAGNALTIPESVRMAVWDRADDLITDIAPRVKNLTRAQSYLMKSARGLQEATEKTAGLPLLGLKSKGLESGVQGIEEIAGRGLQKAGGLVGAIQGAGGGLGGRLARGTVARGIANNSLIPSTPIQNEQVEDPSTQIPGQTQGMSPADAQGGYGPQQSPYSLEAAIADIHRDPKHAKDYMNFYGFINESLQAQNPQGKPLNSTAAGVVTDLQNGIANIRQLSDEFANSGVNGPISGRLRGLNPYDTGAQSLQANVARVKQVIGKALEGGVLRKEDEEKYAKILPTLRDTDAAAQNKIAYIAEDLDRKLQLYRTNLGQGGGGSADLSSLLAGMQGGAY